LSSAVASIHPHGATALDNAIYISLKEFGRTARHNGQVRRQAIAVLSDGEDTSSLVSFEDVLEEIVGDIRDEFDIEHGPIFEFNDQFIVVSGALTMRELQAETGWTFEWQPKETVAMWTQRHFERLPKRGESITVGDYLVNVTDVHAERVRRV